MTLFQKTDEKRAVAQFFSGSNIFMYASRQSFSDYVSMEWRMPKLKVRAFSNLSDYVRAVTNGPFSQASKEQLLLLENDPQLKTGVTLALDEDKHAHHLNCEMINEGVTSASAMGNDSFLYVLMLTVGNNLSDMVEKRYFVHEGGVFAYLLGRAAKDLPFNGNVGEFAGNWSFKQTTGRLDVAMDMDGDRKVQTTAQYEAALEDLASHAAGHLRGSIPDISLEATKNAMLNKLKTEMAWAKPYVQANDMILQLKGAPRGIERNFLRFAAGGSYPADAEISGVFDAFQKAQRK